MKRKIPLVLILIMLFRGPALAEIDFSGEWVAVALSVNGSLYTAETARIESGILFDEDGTVIWTLNENLFTGQWNYDADREMIRLFFADQIFTIEFSPEKELVLNFDENGTRIFYSREKNEPLPSFQPISAESRTAFSGNWVAAYWDFDDGHILPLNESDQVVAGLVIDGETVSFVAGINGSVLPQYDTFGAYSDGKMILAPIDHSHMEIEEIMITESGLLFMPVRIFNATEDFVVNFYFVKAEDSRSMTGMLSFRPEAKEKKE